MKEVSTIPKTIGDWIQQNVLRIRLAYRNEMMFGSVQLLSSQKLVEHESCLNKEQNQDEDIWSYS